jgi:hypothetical protein
MEGQAEIGEVANMFGTTLIPSPAATMVSTVDIW